jgi:hypothetical protein
VGKGSTADFIAAERERSRLRLAEVFDAKEMNLTQFDTFLHELRTQDNAATAYPLFCVQQKRRIWGFDPRFDFLDFVWQRVDDFEWRVTDDDIQDVIYEELVEVHGEPASDVDEVVDDRVRNPTDHGWEKVYYEDTWEFVNAHFTRRAAEIYIASRASTGAANGLRSPSF